MNVEKRNQVKIDQHFEESSDCSCLSILVFPLCCPQNSTEGANIGKVIFLTLLTSEILLSAT